MGGASTTWDGVDPVTASRLARLVSSQERLPVAFTGGARRMAGAAVAALLVEGLLYCIPVTPGDSSWPIIDEWAYSVLDVWGWGSLALTLAMSGAAVGLVLAVITQGFAAGPAWVHIFIAPMPLVAAILAVPFAIFALMWAIAIALMVLMGALIAFAVIAAVACLIAGGLD